MTLVLIKAFYTSIARPLTYKAIIATEETRGVEITGVEKAEKIINLIYSLIDAKECKTVEYTPDILGYTIKIDCTRQAVTKIQETVIKTLSKR